MRLRNGGKRNEERVKRRNGGDATEWWGRESGKGGGWEKISGNGEALPQQRAGRAGIDNMASGHAGYQEHPTAS